MFSCLGFEANHILTCLEECGGLVFGSMFVLLLIGCQFKPQNLDVIVPAIAAEPSIHTIQHAYSLRVGLEIIPQALQNLCNVQSVIVLSNDQACMQIVVAHSSNVLIPVFSSHSSVAMNYLTKGEIIFCTLLMKIIMILRQQLRQFAQKNLLCGTFIMPERSCCMQGDVTLLNDHVLKNSQIQSDSVWLLAPIIIASNAAKDILNDKLAGEFAVRTQQQSHWYYAQDRLWTQTEPASHLIHGELQDKLLLLHSGQARQCLGKILLVIRMPVLIMQNFDNFQLGEQRKDQFFLKENKGWC